MTSRQFGITIYSLMSFLHLVASIMFYAEGNTLGAVMQLLGSIFWFVMLQFDTQLKD